MPRLVRSATLAAELIAVAESDGVQWACSAIVRMSRGRRPQPVVEVLHGFERGDEGTPVDVTAVPDEAYDALRAAAVASYLAQTAEDDSDDDRAADHYLEQRKEARMQGWD